MIFRLAVQADKERIWEILQQAKAQMYREGKHQWNDDYPAPANIDADISCGCAYVLCRNEKVIAYAAVVFTGEPVYKQLEEQWLTKGDYVVVHRLAVADEAKRQGIATFFMQEVERLAVDKGVFAFRIDTNYDNFYIQKMVKKLGFTYCGEVVYHPNGKRLAFEKVLKA